MENKELIELALEARKNSYSPYSGFKVGAALLCKNGRAFTGCNIENASFSPTCCAERTAFFKAVSEGEKEFDRIVIVGGKGDSEPSEFCTPCGVCRQVMNEFCNEDFIVIIAKNQNEFREYKLSEILPLSFGKKILNTKERL